MFKVWPLLLALCFLWSFPEVFCSHFRGGTISWKPDPYIPLKVLFKFNIAWRRSSSEGGSCNAQTISSRQLISGGQWACLSGACNGQAVGLTDYYCTSYSAQDDWTQGGNTFNFTFPSAGSYDIGYKSCCWIPLANGGSSWALGTTVNLVTRRDKIGVINSSPITSTFPTQVFTQGCSENLRIRVADPDNDIVRCRWASGSGECGSVCGAYQLGNLDQASCTLSYNGQGSVGWYAVALMLEDFYPGSSSFTTSDALSKVGFQFLVKVVANSHSSCNVKPFLTSNSPRDGACVAIPIGQTYRATLEASHNDISQSISDIIIVAPLGMTKSTVTRTGYDSRGGGIWSTQVAWTPQQAQIGQHILCFKAQDSSGQESSQRCVTLLAGSNAPKPDLSSRSPNTAYLSPRRTYTWSIAFDNKIARPSSPRYIRFKSSGGHTVHTIDTSSSPDVYIDNTTNTLRFTVSGSSLSGYRSYHILMDRGVVEGTLGCSGSGPSSPGIASSSAWTFNLGCRAGFSLNSARTSCIDEDECATSNGNCSHTCANTAGSYRCTCPDSELTLDTDGKTCKAPGMAITCRSDSMLVTFTRQMLSGLDEQHVRLNDPSCTAVGNATHISFWVPLDGCGTTHTDSTDTITYKNKVISRAFHVGGVITRVREVEILFHCSYGRKMTLGFVSFRPNTRKLRVFERGYGNFTFLFNMFHTSSFLRPYTDSEYPVDVNLRQQLYFQLQVKSNDSDLVLFVDTCKATPSVKSHSKPEYVFIKRGCNLDSTLAYNYNLLPVQRFNMEAFRFIASHSVVYIHCDVIVCHKSASSSRCAQGCVPGPSIGRKRRQLSSQVGTSSAHYVISEGPVRFDAERSEDKVVAIPRVPERPQDSGVENIATVPLFVVLAAIVVLSCVSVIIALYKKKRAGRPYQPIPRHEVQPLMS